MVDLTTNAPDYSPVDSPVVSPGSDGRADFIQGLGNVLSNSFGQFMEGRDKAKLNELSIALTNTDHITNRFNEGLGKDNFDPLTPEEAKDITQTEHLLRLHKMKQQQRGVRGVGVDTTTTVLNDFKRRNPRLAIDADSLFSGTTGRSPGAAIRELEQDPVAEEILSIEGQMAAENQNILDKAFELTGQDFGDDVEGAKKRLGEVYKRQADYRLRALQAEGMTDSQRKSAITKNVVANILPEAWANAEVAINRLVKRVTQSLDEDLETPRVYSAQERKAYADILVETEWANFRRLVNQANIGGDDTAMQRQLETYENIVQTLKDTITGTSSIQAFNTERDLMAAFTNNELLHSINSATGRTYAEEKNFLDLARGLLNAEEKAAASGIQRTANDILELTAISQMSDRDFRNHLYNSVNAGENPESLYLNMIGAIDSLLVTNGEGVWNQQNLLGLVDKVGLALNEVDEPTEAMFNSTIKLLGNKDSYQALNRNAPVLLRQTQHMLDMYSKAAVLSFKDDLGGNLSRRLSRSVGFFDLPVGPILDEYLKPDVVEGVVFFGLTDKDSSKLRQYVVKELTKVTPNRPEGVKPSPKEVDERVQEYEAGIERAAQEMDALYRERFQDLLDARVNVSGEKDLQKAFEHILEGKSLFQGIKLQQQEDAKEGTSE